MVHESRLIDEASPQLFDPDFWKEHDKVIGSAQGRGTTWFVNLGNIFMLPASLSPRWLVLKIGRSLSLFCLEQNTLLVVKEMMIL
ncbi:hypothetical protein OH492_00110 [Vibrio chagasii]|nr:hypothetical protein [Vibrio chagasii]